MCQLRIDFTPFCALQAKIIFFTSVLEQTSVAIPRKIRTSPPPPKKNPLPLGVCALTTQVGEGMEGRGGKKMEVPSTLNRHLLGKR